MDPEEEEKQTNYVSVSTVGSFLNETQFLLALLSFSEYSANNFMNFILLSYLYILPG